MPNLFATEIAAGYARIAVERGVDRYPEGLTYAIPQSLRGLGPGDRVIVPLGRGNTRTAGHVIEISNSIELDPDSIKPIIARDAGAARLPGQLLELARWISNYYCSPIGMTLASMLPAAVKKNIGSVQRAFIELAEPCPADLKLSPKQKLVVQTLAALPAHERPIEVKRLMERAGLSTAAPIKRLLELGALVEHRRSVIEAEWAAQALDTRVPERLTDEQAGVIDSISAQLGRGFSTHLLFGVTGSGKTEVYIRLIQRVLAMGRMALMLVPEISLTPQTGGRLIGRFPDRRVAVLHSGLTAAQRHQQWALAAEGRADIVLGARSAVFAPIPDGRIGLVIVDEEHDGSYKQDQVPRYHGRDVAIRRAQMAACPIVLGSATPSLESWFNATARGSSTLHRLANRAPGLRLPKVQVVDFRQQMKQRGDHRIHLLGPALEQALRRTLDEGGQALLLLNRRGYANYIACPSTRCGWIMTCDHCDVTTVYHLNRRLPASGAGRGGEGGGYVRCHHCLSEQRLPALCPQCGGRITTFGLGTQRVEEELMRDFPELVENQTLVRIDSDSMQGSRRFHDVLGRFGDGSIRVLLGTQMIAKGLDFPGVRLVGVINADTSINLPDFRASERTFQLVSQVAGRSGRGSDPGLTIVQTFNPDSPAIRLAAAHDFEAFAAIELAERTRAGLPPTTRMARIVLRDPDLLQCTAAARMLARKLEEIAIKFNQPKNELSDQNDRNLDQKRGFEEEKVVNFSQMPQNLAPIRLRGPAPCPIARIADQHRQQIEILAANPSILQGFLAQARSTGLIKAGANMAIDVDPIALL